MRLLPPGLRYLLPPTSEVQNLANPFVYARFFSPDEKRVWYVVAGQPQGMDFLFGVRISNGTEWNTDTVLLSYLETLRDERGLRIERDLFFKTARLSQLLANPSPRI